MRSYNINSRKYNIRSTMVSRSGKVHVQHGNLKHNMKQNGNVMLIDEMQAIANVITT